MATIPHSESGRVLPLTTKRSMSAAGLALAAIALMIGSAVKFMYDPNGFSQSTVDAVVLALLGGVALFFATRLSSHNVEAPKVAEHPMIGGKAQWFLIIPGLLLLALGTEISADVLKTETLPFLAPHIQFLALSGGLILFTLGVIGVRWFSLPRANRRYVLIIGVILLVAFIIRSYQLDTLVRLTVDEGHFMYGVSTLYPLNGELPTDLLTTVSGNLPATMIYSYINYISTMIWGRNFVGLRIANTIIGTLTVLAVYGTGRALFNRRLAIVGALIMATFPVHVFFSRVSMGQLSDTLFATLAIMFAARGYRWNRRGDWVMMGVCLGVAQYFFEGGRLLYPPLFISWIILLVLTLRSKSKPLRHGLFLGVIVSIVIITPMYFTMWYTESPFNSRLNSSGFDINMFGQALRGELNEEQQNSFFRHLTDPFLVYTFLTHRGLMEMYGGTEPLVLRVCVPLFLLGVFHVLWRIRSASALLLLALLGASVGSVFVADAAIFPRYILITPTLALLISIGLVCTVPLLNPFSSRMPAVAQLPADSPARRRSWATGAFAVYGLAIVFAGVQLYYFTNHLIPEFNYSARATNSTGDLFDAAFRFIERPNARHEQMRMYDPGYGVANTVNEFFAYSMSPYDYPAEVRLSSETTVETLDGLPRDRTYAFFVLPRDERMIELLHESFALELPTYSSYQSPLLRSLYVMFVAPHEKNLVPLHVTTAGLGTVP